MNNKTDSYYLYNMSSSSGHNNNMHHQHHHHHQNGDESPLAMIKILNSAIKNKHHHQQQLQTSQKKAVNPHRPVYATKQAHAASSNQMVKSTAHTSIQKLVKLDTNEFVLHPPPSGASITTTTNPNYLIKYPVQV